MTQKALSRWLKGVIAGVGLCGLIVYLAVVPECGRTLRAAYPEFSGWFWPWLVFLWLTAVPCYGALAIGWGVADRVGLDQSFSEENARALKRVAYLAAGDTAYFFIGNIALGLLGMNHPGVMALALLCCFAGVAVSIGAACLSHLIRKAADLQRQSDLTI